MSKVNFKGSVMLNPVPVVLVTSINSKGDMNVFTAAWVGTVCTKPPMISLSIRPERLSYKYIEETSEFVINLPNKDLVKQVDLCGVKSGSTLNKFKACNLQIENSKTVKSPIIKQCPVALECKLKQIIPLGTHDLFLAEVTSINIEENLIDNNGKFHLENADLICYSHGEYFPISKKPVGKFGFSVKKKNKK